jgi:single-stranded DNA-specific DHH superfamily exonuclease
MIITDHHQALNSIPNAYAVINPQVSDDYSFK